MKENIQMLLGLKEDASECELVTYLKSLNTNELKEIYDSYYYSKEIESENYNKTFFEYQEYSTEEVDNIIMELSQGKTLHALTHYLENIDEKIQRHEQEIERKRAKEYFEEERLNEWRKTFD